MNPGQDRDSMRAYYCTVLEKDQAGKPLEPLEQIIATILRQHPEYHEFLKNRETALEQEFTPENGQQNPFLHMGMHIAIHEQIGADRPPGIRDLYQQIAAGYPDPHEAEHAMMECLGLALWEAQRENRAPDDQAYLGCLTRLATK